MNGGGNFNRRIPLVVVVLLVLLPASAFAQVFARPFAPSPAVVSELNAAGMRLLERSQTLAGAVPPTDAVEAILQVIDRHGKELVRVKSLDEPIPKDASDFELWWPADRYCQQQLREWKSLHPAALTLYRSFIDQALDDAIAHARTTPDLRPLENALHRFGAGTHGSQGWQLLGELLLEQGDLAAAQIAFTRGVEFSDEKSERANALARLALVAILSGNQEAADQQLQRLKETDPQAQGKLAGEVGPWLELLEGFRKQHASDIPRDLSTECNMFAGNSARSGSSPALSPNFDLGAKPLWSLPLPRITGDGDVLATGRRRIAESGPGLCAYHPLLIGDTVYLRQDVAGQTTVQALAWENGHQQWYFEQPLPLPEEKNPPRESEHVSDAERLLPPHVGTTRYTLTECDGTLFARMGSPLTAPAARHIDSLRTKDQGWLIGLDLATQGRPKEGFPLYPATTEWTWEGTPLADEGHIYVLRSKRDGTRRQLHLACFARLTTPVDTSQGNNDGLPRGRVVWQTLIAAADTVGVGDLGEISHGLISRVDNRLLVNTNLGAVAAVDAGTGQIEWLVRYPRAPFTAAPNVSVEAHYFRDLAPPVVTPDGVVFAPQDCTRVFACDLGSGRVKWMLSPEVSNDVMHLLGVSEGKLVATGKQVVWIDMATGNVDATYFPPPAIEPLGRGVLTRDSILWPTNSAIVVLPSAAKPNVQPLKIIDLAQRSATGGNLIAAPNGLLIASGSQLYAFEFTTEK